MIKTIVCGREWCLRCGKDGSEFHKRRITRLIDRVYSMPVVGYGVFEISVQLRGYFEDIEALRDARRYLHRLIKRELNCKGVSRWHFYGNKHVIYGANGSILAIVEDEPLKCGDYKPHLNVLISHGSISKKRLRRIRLLWSKWQFAYCHKKYYRIAPFHYKYTRKEYKLYHWVKYITRSTFKTLNTGNEHIARGLFKLNNVSWFGTFNDEDKLRGRERFDAWVATLPANEAQDTPEMRAHDAFNESLCPVCGCFMFTHKHVVRFESYDVLTDYGGGLYLVEDKNAKMFDELEAMLLRHKKGSW